MNVDLTTLARYKTFVGLASNSVDALISQLITRASGQITKYCTRSFYRKTQTNMILDGTGTGMMQLPQAPLINVSYLAVEGAQVDIVSDPNVQRGYSFNDSTVYAPPGCKFPYKRRSINISFVSGFNASMTETIPDTPYITTPTQAGDDDGSGFPAVDFGVTFAATGTALVSVASNPVSGQYVFSPGQYQYAAADKGKVVIENYDYIPSAVEQACIELVAFKIKQRDTIGVQSRSMATETVTYTDTDMSKSIRTMLDHYNRRAPV